MLFGYIFLYLYLYLIYLYLYILIFNINIAWPKHSFHISKKEVSLLISTVFRGYLFIFSAQERGRFRVQFVFPNFHQGNASGTSEA